MTPGAKSDKPNNSAPARLVLQGPLASDQAQTPSPRISTELLPSSESGMDRSTAQETWEALQLQLEDVIALRTQVKQTTIKAAEASKAVTAARADAAGLRSQLALNEEQRFQHPLVYGLGAATVCAGFMWVLERRRRIAAQRPVPTLFSAQAAVVQKTPLEITSAQTTFASNTKQEVTVQRFAPAKPWWRSWFSAKSKMAPSVLMLQSASSIQNSKNNVVTGFDFLSSMQHSVNAESEFLDPEFAQIDLFTQTRLKPSCPADGMGHLLEMRMATQALCTLGQPMMAQRLLLQHIDAVPNTSGWAYLEYLALCARFNQREDFEAMRLRFRSQFNRLAPYWMEPQSKVQDLESYERPLAELSTLWPTDRAKALIQTWLLGNLHARRLFQLPAYHDLLDLYDLLEHIDGTQKATEHEAEIAHTVSVLDLDYEFSENVKLQAPSEEELIRVIPTVKTGVFAVDVQIP